MLAYGVVFAAAFTVTWFSVPPSGQPDPAVSRADTRVRRRPSEVTPGERLSSSQTSIRPPTMRVVETPARLSRRQAMIRDHGDVAVATWAVVSQVELEFFNERYRSTYESNQDPSSADWPWNCGEELLRGTPPIARLRITSTPNRIVASHYEIVSSGLRPEVVQCLEDYFEGSTAIERRADDPEFLSFTTSTDAPAFMILPLDYGNE